MKSTLSLILGLAALCNSYAQDLKKGQINIPGTHVFITAPPVYKIAPAFMGLQAPDYTIMLTEDELVSYDSISGSYTPDFFKTNGMTVYEHMDTMVAGYRAKFFHTGNSQTHLYVLLFGNRSFCVTVNGIYPADQTDTAGRIKNTILSVTYDSTVKIDPLAAAPFILDASKSKYKFFARLTGTYIYSTDSISRANGQLVTVAVLPADALTTPRSVSEMSLRQLAGSGFTFKEYKDVSTKRVNGYEVYEADVYGELGGKNITFYHFAAVHQDKAILIQGLAPEDYDKSVSEFKKLAHTVRFK